MNLSPAGRSELPGEKGTIFHSSVSPLGHSEYLAPSMGLMKVCKIKKGVQKLKKRSEGTKLRARR